MSSAKEIENYEHLASSFDQENDKHYDTLEPVAGTEDAPAKGKKNENFDQGEKHEQPLGVEQINLKDLSEHGVNAPRASVTLETGIPLSRYDRWIRRFLAVTCVQCLLTIGCWVAIGMLFMHSVNDDWSVWSEWSSCSRTCGPGIQSRNRSCNRPALSFLCHGIELEYGSCETVPCAVNGDWSDWSEWSSCSRTCGPGIQARNRSCNTPALSSLSFLCHGNQVDYGSCETVPCVVNGDWSDWSDWSSCSRTCGPGIRARNRSCNASAQSTLGFLCHGNPVEYGSCETASCAAHVAFYAYFKSGSSTSPVVFDIVEMNDGNAYNSATGIFTSPVAGRYLFSVTALSRLGSHAGVYLYKNNNTIGQFYTGTGETDRLNSGALTHVTDLDQGDQVKVHSTHVLYNYGVSYTSFSGVLLSKK